MMKFDGKPKIKINLVTVIEKKQAEPSSKGFIPRKEWWSIFEKPDVGTLLELNPLAANKESG